MKYTKELLLNDRVFFYFDQICRIPRGSGNEKAVSDFILSKAEELGLEAFQDSLNNLLIRKKAFTGYEDSPSIMLQAHLDMVCEKSSDSNHNFETDPILWQIDGDTINTGGKTTLGADDGIGVALAMAVLEDNSLPHPELEVLFTVREESDFAGISSFDQNLIHSDYLINLDNSGTNQIMCGSCGGMQVDWIMPVKTTAVPDNWNSYNLRIYGLKGGHSGEDINLGRGSAAQILVRALMTIDELCEYMISDIKCGTLRMAIPRDADTLISFSPEALPSVKSALKILEDDVRHELAVTSDNVQITIEPAMHSDFGTKPGNIISAITLLPDGIFQMNEKLKGLVDTSDNIGEIYLTQDDLHLVIEIRSARESLGKYLAQRMNQLAILLGAKCIISNEYPSWDYHPDSKLQQVAKEAYISLFNELPEILTLHAGLEVGNLFAGKPDLDAISLGPDCKSLHSPEESLSIKATFDMYKYLCKILENFK